MRITKIGLDLAKNIFQVCGVTADGDIAFNRPVRRAGLLKFFEKLPPCLVGCLLYTSPSPRDATLSRMPSSA